jgi:hypothetical protein
MRRNPVLLEFLLAERAREETPLVMMGLEVDDMSTSEIGFGEANERVLSASVLAGAEGSFLPPSV